MGYQTSYSLKAELFIGGRKAELVDDSPLQEVIKELRDTNGNAEYALDIDGETGETCKWYEHEAELKSFSAKHPNVLFTLHGEGEETGDIWDKYFLNGKCQVDNPTF